MPTETKIHADIEAIRSQVTETQELYREVCTILFFRYGITPTANKLYQYVRKGSMSAPAEALAKFWEDLREKSRVRIEHPDLPDALKSAAGELVATVWSQAQLAAQEGLAAYRSEARAAILEAQTALATAEHERAAALLDRDLARQAAQDALNRVLQLERNLAAERAGKEALSTQLETAGCQQAALETALTEARRDFAIELEKLCLALERSEERCQATEKRALLEIDRERTAAVKVQKDLTQARQYQQEADDLHRAELARLQADVGDARQKLGVAEGMLQEMRTRCQHQAEELQSLRTSLSEGEIRKSLLERDLTVCRESLARLEDELQRRIAAAPESEATKPRKRSRKTVG